MNLKRISLLAIGTIALLASCNKNSVTEDSKTVDSLNNALSGLASKDIAKPYDAISYLKDKKKIDVENTKVASNHQLAFNMNSKKFVLMQGDNLIYNPDNTSNAVINTYDIFKITSTYDASSVYSQYLTSKFEGADLLVATTGIDMGSNKNVKKVTYYNVSGIQKNVTLNLFCDYLEISAPNDTITFHGSANNMFIYTDTTCNYYGSTAYCQVNAGDFTLEPDSYVDIFETPTGSSANLHQFEGSIVLGAINTDKVACQSDIRYCEVSTKEELTAKITQNYNFFRLIGDIDQSIEFTSECLDVTKNLFIDLNGRSMKFNGGEDRDVTEESGTPVKYKAGIHVHADNSKTDKDDVYCYLMDSKSTRYQRSGLYFTDCSFLVDGSSPDYSINLFINSGKIHDIRNKVNQAAVFLTGNIDNVNPDRVEHKCNARFYGGYIKSETGPEYTVGGPSFKCVQPRGKGCVVDLYYGDLESNHYCVSGQGSLRNVDADTKIDRFGDYTINVYGGYFISKLAAGDYTYTPFFFPSKCNVNIDGGYIYSHQSSCISAKAGSYKITGATLYAAGDYNPTQVATVDGSTADGSVIFIESNARYCGGYLNPVNIAITNTTMTSKNGNIFTVAGYENAGTTYYVNETITIDGGTFNYKNERYVVREEIQDKVLVKINGGTWNKQSMR